MVRRQQAFRVAADVVAGALSEFSEVEAVAVIGSAARPLWKEVPRFGGFRRKQIMIWHECGDLDLAVWVTSCERLEKMRQARDQSLAAAGRNLFRDRLGPLPLAVTGHQAEVFLFEPGRTGISGGSAVSVSARRASPIARRRAVAPFPSTRWFPVSCHGPIFWKLQPMPRCTAGGRGR